jgi:translation elongation factor EF-Tu-like GTPase
MRPAPLSAYIVAEVNLLSPNDGGRRSPIVSGYRCNCWIGKELDGKRTYNDATFFILSTDRIEPGDRGYARVEPHFPDEWSQVEEGSFFELCEGQRAIGTARVTGLFPEEK